jgi:hypothetical protein
MPITPRTQARQFTAPWSAAQFPHRFTVNET